MNVDWVNASDFCLLRRNHVNIINRIISCLLMVIVFFLVYEGGVGCVSIILCLY